MTTDQMSVLNRAGAALRNGRPGAAGDADSEPAKLRGRIAWLLADTAAGKAMPSAYAKLLALAGDGAGSSACDLTPEESHSLSLALDREFCDILILAISGAARV